MDLKDIRQDYRKHELSVSELMDNPLDLLAKWYDQAIEDKNPEPNAMSLSTVNSKLEVSSRIVLLKEVIDGSLRFFTNYSSQKGQEIGQNNNVALLFFWSLSERQIRIKGKVKKTSDKVSDDYFYSRPIGSQAGAASSPQSEVLESKDALIYKFEELKNSDEIKRPINWGGYDVEPFEIEFWQGGMNRLHDRFRYIKVDGNWKIERLAP